MKFYKNFFFILFSFIKNCIINIRYNIYGGITLKRKFLLILFFSLIVCLITACSNSDKKTIDVLNNTDTVTESTTNGTSDTSATTDTTEVTTEGTTSVSETEPTTNDTTEPKTSGSTKFTNNLTITKAGTYTYTGVKNSPITVKAGDEDDVTIVLSNLTINNKQGPAIIVESGKNVYLELAGNTTNTLSDGTSYSITNESATVDGAVFSACDLKITGTGTLIVNGNYKHGIVSKDDLEINSGTVKVTSKNVALNGKDSVEINGGNITLNAGTDAVRADNIVSAAKGNVFLNGGTLNIVANNDGIQAEQKISISNINLNIQAGGGSSNLSASEKTYKALKSTSDINISGGTITLDSQGDCISSDSNIYITNGNLTLYSGDDAISANGNFSISKGNIKLTTNDAGITTDNDLNISGGYIYINSNGKGLNSKANLNISGGTTLINGSSSVTGNSAISFKSSGNITGGVLVALSNCKDKAQSLTSANQGIILAKFAQQKSNDLLAVCDPNGKVIASIKPNKNYQVAIVSTPSVIVGNDYSIVTGASVSSTDTYGYASNTTKTGGNELTSTSAK